MKQFYVYAHLKPDFTPFYIGKGYGDRAHDLRHFVRNKYHANTVAKYGAANIIIETMPCKTEAEAFLREMLAIKSLRGAGVKLCNMTDGGEGLSNPSQETREKMSKSAMGKIVSAETKLRMSLAGKGKLKSEDTRAKMSASQMGNSKGSGTKRSSESRAKMSLAQMGNKKGVGRKCSDAEKARISAMNKGKIVSEETRAKLSAARKRRIVTAETRAKLSASGKVRWSKIKAR